MKSASSSFISALASRDVRLAVLWRLEQTNGNFLLFTDHDTDIKVGTDIYEAKTGFTMSSILQASGSSTQGCTITSAMRGPDAPLNEADLRAGAYDSAVCEILVIHWNHPEYGMVSIFTGLVGETKITNEGQIEITVERLGAGTQIVLDKYSATCRASFGDDRCKYPIDDLMVTFTVVSGTDDRQSFVALETAVEDTVQFGADYWQYGTVTFDTGLNRGIATKCMSSDVDGTIVMFAALPFVLSEGDTGRIWPGCDLQFTSGCTRWNNRINFRGEPGYQVVKPPEVLPGATPPVSTPGQWQGWYIPDRTKKGHGFFWAYQKWWWSGSGAPDTASPAEGWATSVGPASNGTPLFPYIQGTISVNGGQNPYTFPGGTPDPVR